MFNEDTIFKDVDDFIKLLSRRHTFNLLFLIAVESGINFNTLKKLTGCNSKMLTEILNSFVDNGFISKSVYGSKFNKDILESFYCITPKGRLILNLYKEIHSVYIMVSINVRGV